MKMVDARRASMWEEEIWEDQPQVGMQMVVEGGEKNPMRDMVTFQTLDRKKLLDF